MVLKLRCRFGKRGLCISDQIDMQSIIKFEKDGNWDSF